MRMCEPYAKTRVAKAIFTQFPKPWKPRSALDPARGPCVGPRTPPIAGTHVLGGGHFHVPGGHSNVGVSGSSKNSRN